MKKSKKSLMFFIIGVLIGSTLVSPIQAKVSTVTSKWLDRYYYSKSESNSRYYSKTQTNSKFSNYYDKNSLNTLLASYLKTTDASSGYLTQANASNTYLTQANATSTYISQTDASNNYLAKSGGILAGGLTAPSYSLSSPESKTITIPATAFQPKDSNIVLAQDITGLYKESGTSSYIFAPVSLPNGAIITNMTLYYDDTDPVNNVNGNLSVNSLASGGVITTSGFVQSTGGTGNGSNSITPNITIDNDNRYYVMYLDFTSGTGSSLTVNALKITYTVSSL